MPIINHKGRSLVIQHSIVLGFCSRELGSHFGIKASFILLSTISNKLFIMSSPPFQNSSECEEVPFVVTDSGSIGIKFGKFSSLEPKEVKSVIIKTNNNNMFIQTQVCMVVSDQHMLKVGLEAKSIVINPNNTFIVTLHNFSDKLILLYPDIIIAQLAFINNTYIYPNENAFIPLNDTCFNDSQVDFDAILNNLTNDIDFLDEVIQCEDPQIGNELNTPSPDNILQILEPVCVENQETSLLCKNVALTINTSTEIEDGIKILKEFLENLLKSKSYTLDEFLKMHKLIEQMSKSVSKSESTQTSVEVKECYVTNLDLEPISP